MRGLTLLSLLTLPLSGSAQETLAWKFAAGDAFLLQRDSQTEMAITLKGQTLKQVVQRNSTFRIDVTQPGRDRTALKVTAESMAVQHLAGKASVESKLLERMRGAVFQLEVTPQGRVKAMTGYEELVAQLAEKKDDVAKVVRQMWPEELWRQEFDEMLGVVPERTVKVGERWEETDTMLLPPLGSFALRRRKAYTENDRAGHAHLAATYTGTYQPPLQPADFFRVLKGELVIEKGAWECTFDRERGRLLQSRKQMEIQGPVTIELMGMPTQVEMTMRGELTAKVLAKAP